MFHVDNNSAVPVMPAVKPVVSAVTSFFTEGGNGVPPTYPGPDWFNIIQSELLAVLAAAGITPDKASNVQLLAAMRALFLDTSQNGADIQDKALFLQNLGLGTAALRTVGTGANNIPDMSSFASGTGWSRLPNGKILQWGSYTNPGSVFSGTISFPVPFVSTPGRVLMTSFHTTIDSNPIVLAQDTSKLSLTDFSWRLSTTGPARSFNWWSIGE